MRLVIVQGMALLVALALLWCPLAASNSLRSEEEQQENETFVTKDSETYGVDVSMPIHRRVSTNYAWLPHNADPDTPVPVEYENMPVQPLGDRQAQYVRHIDGCRKFYGAGASRCDVFEYDRMLMNMRQPQSMQNYTEIGFKKMRAPQELIDLATNFWEKNKLAQVQENWGIGNTYLNSWEAPSYMVSVDDKGLRGSGSVLKNKIWNAAQDILEDWTSQDLQPTSLYGIRVYTDGAVLLPHVDRLPLVSSLMINVAQEVEEDWPMEIYDHTGVAHNVTLHPGDMMLFESHSALHGRPFPLKGKYYAMLFVHFEPTGHSLRHYGQNPDEDVDEQYRQASEDGFGGQSASFTALPPYINRESPEEAHWRREHPEGWKKPAGSPASKSLHEKAHQAAATGDVKTLSQEIKLQKTKAINKRDDNGWQPIHEAAAGGQKETLEMLVQNGADVNTRTLGGRGGTPLHLASQRYGAFHPVVKYLKNLGALNVGPEL